jgi:hypothetical protein
MHYGQVCLAGLLCTEDTTADRTMADFHSCTMDGQGRIRVVFNDNTNQHNGAQLFEARQLSGPSLKGTVLNDPVPSNPMPDPMGDAQWPHYAPVVGPGANVPQLDFTQVGLSQPTATTLRVQMTLKDLSSLLPPTGKTNAFWITRFQALSTGDAGQEAYRIFYVGAESVGGMAPTFFAGSGTAADINGVPGNGCVTTTPQLCKVVQYPAEVVMVTGSVSGNNICIDVPNFKTTGFGAGRPINGTSLYNVTAFSGGRNNAMTDVYADVDATRSFDFQVGTVSTVPLLSVGSRKVHTGVGFFDVDLPLAGPPGIECRTGGANGNYTMVFTFSNPVASCGSASTGSVSSGPLSTQCTVNLTGVPNAHFLTVNLIGVADTACNTGNVSGTMGVLTGDTNADGNVDGTDVSQTKSKSGSSLSVTPSAFREDINLDGFVDGTDVSFVKSRSGGHISGP